MSKKNVLSTVAVAMLLTAVPLSPVLAEEATSTQPPVTTPMMPGRPGGMGMMNPEMMQQRQQMMEQRQQMMQQRQAMRQQRYETMQQHMNKIENHLVNIEALLRQLVELNKGK